ncbi:transferase hexapeptide (six repeat-containing protein) [Parapedobacter luteus]|uniref:Transferase hexapeptide (Six repeat-containing protein) n=1 Tax=Parapedobacter luteus TaxID=623280 RepID=A0A1T5FQN8_9SPHI|nr:hypothetical protein [Parapedobacter luteus]SKB98463.1 transferase hexapeptide (six repeat-containing protein) [Parapedobacter luteus]
MIKKLFVFLLPWALRRRLLNAWFGYEIHPKARIGFAWIYPKKLVMKEKARIAHFTVAIHLDYVELGCYASIGRKNWITGFPTSGTSQHFAHQRGSRRSELFLGEHSAITKNHHIDCTNRITIGRFVTIAGYQSQLLTHSINIEECRQDSYPIYIGDYCFIGTNSVILGGAKLPPYSILGAKSLLNKAFEQQFALYAGVPAAFVKPVNSEAKFFTRQTGYVI